MPYISGWPTYLLTSIYQKVFLKISFWEIKEFSDYFTFQQDLAPAYQAKKTPDFIQPSLLPSNCPDLNMVDYKILDALQQRDYSLKIQNVDELQQMETPRPGSQAVLSSSSLLCGYV